MFSFFSSKNQKLVKQWKKEHQEIVALATKIIDDHTKGRLGSAKKALKKLTGLAAHHLMEEDAEIISLVKDEKRNDPEIVFEIERFKKAFVSTKKVVIDFLWDYSQPDAKLNEDFINQFKNLVDVLAKRIEFEEKNLYVKLESK